MIVFWGKKTTVTKIGYVADYCVICREISEFRVDRINLASHIYGIALDAGQPLGFSQTCLSCEITIDSTPDRFHGISENSNLAIRDLVRQTHPDVTSKFSDQLALGEQIANAPETLSPNLRIKLIVETLQMAVGYFDREQEVSGDRILLFALSPLDPTLEEISETLRHLQRVGSSRREPLDAAKILRRMERGGRPQEYDY